MTRRDDLVALLREARDDIAAYVDADYPPEYRAKYYDIQRRWHRDMELCRRIDALISQEDAPMTAGVTVQEAAKVLLDAMGRAQIDMSILRLFFNGEPSTALRALSEGRT